MSTDIHSTSSDSASAYGHLITRDAIDVTHNVILYLEEVTVSFDGFRALNDLSLTIAPGEMRCVIGPNGAGKTTMMDVITGKTRPDAGKVFFGQTIDLTRRTEPDIASLGIGRKFQKPTVFETLTAFENLELALKADKRARTAVSARLDGEDLARIDEILYTTNLVDHAFRLAGLLSHGQKQWLEIGMLLAQDPKLLLLDEPVAGMTDQETERTAELFISLEGKHSLIVVEHDMDFIASIAQGRRITVLAEGSVLAEGTMEQIQRDEAVIEAYLGR